MKMMEEKKVVKPYNDRDTSKKEEVATMFNNISKRYESVGDPIFVWLGGTHGNVEYRLQDG